MKLLSLWVLLGLSLPAFSQTCYVDMVAVNSGRVVRSFSAYGDDRCVEGMKECRKSIRFDYSNNPQYPNGSLDCVADRNSSPIPQPQPYPQPQPQPYPQPYPQPVPQPYPQPNPYRSVDANSLILDIASVINSTESETKIMESLIINSNSYSLRSLAQICSSARTWQENAQCLNDGVRRAPREILDESSAIHATAQACVLTKSWIEEENCFEITLRNNRLPSLSYLAPSCSNMYSSESSARCYRQVFGVR